MPRRVKLKNRLFANRAFSVCGSGDSHRRRVYTEDAKAFTDVEALVSSLESEIHALAESGNRDGLRRALYLYLRLRGVL